MINITTSLLWVLAVTLIESMKVVKHDTPGGVALMLHANNDNTDLNLGLYIQQSLKISSTTASLFSCLFFLFLSY